ncbi:MAG TPA: MlaD family protein [Gemmatimonadaceae bacterium]|nr:MlaD family protein [Gemmatimonadaceae bacterium]
MKRGQSRLGLLAFLGTTFFVLIALIALARYPALFRSGKDYRVAFRAVPGLNLGDEVRYGGLLVGSITALELDPRDPTRVAVGIRVRDETPVQTDTRAEINQVGLLGAPYLNLVAGTGTAPEIPPGGTILSRDIMSFQDAMSRLAQFLDRADTLLGGVERLAEGSPWDRIDHSFSGLDSLISEMRAGTGRIVIGLDTTTQQLAALLDRSEHLVSAIDTVVSAAAPQVASAQEDLRRTMGDMRLLISELRMATDNGERVEAIVRDLARASDNLAKLSTRLERDPSALLSRRDPPSKPVGPQPRE